MSKKDSRQVKTDSIGYKGQVELGTVRKGKKHRKVVANAGTSALFSYIGSCLLGRVDPNFDSSKRPGKLRLFGGSSMEPVVSYGITFNDLSTSGNTGSDTETEYSVTFSFLIPGTILVGKDIKSVELRDLTDTVTYAKASFLNTITVDDIDTNIYVSWTLTIKNSGN